ncbi:hypothetical protein BDAP_002726 [Binucleata daphniae]
MKLPPSHKLLKLCLTQSLLQSGFQKTSSSSLTTFTSVVEYLIFNLMLKIKENPAEISCKILLKNNDFSNDILQLIKLCKGTGDSVLHVMNIIPKNIDWRGKGGGIKVTKEGGEIHESMQDEFVYDDFVYDFIDNTHKYEMSDRKNEEIIRNDATNCNDENTKCMQNIANAANIEGYNNQTIENQLNENINYTQNIVNHNLVKAQSNEEKDNINENKKIDNINENKKIDKVDESTNQKTCIENKTETQNDFCLDNLVLSITNKKGWFNDKDYKLLLENKRKQQNYLNCYNTAFHNNLIDEFKFLSCKEICKIRRNNKKNEDKKKT